VTWTWRARAKEIAERTVVANLGKPPKEIRKALREALPWDRSGYAYKAWLLEARAALSRHNVPWRDARGTMKECIDCGPLFDVKDTLDERPRRRC